MPKRSLWFVDGPLANRNYVLFLGGAFVSSLGSWMQVVAMGWLVLQLGNSAFLLGLLGFAQTAPVLVVGVYAGVLADRRDRRTVLLLTQGAATMLTLLLTVLEFQGAATVTALLLIAGGNGIVNALNGPAWQSFIKDLVGPDQLRRAIALNSGRFNLTRILGPAIGGWLLVAYGAVACFAFNALSFLAVIVALLLIRPAHTTASSRLEAAGASTLEVARNPGIRAVLLPAMGLAIFAMPYASFLPAMARDVFHSGAAGLSQLLTATGAGAVLGAVISGNARVARQPGRALALFQTSAGLSLALFAVAPGQYGGVAAMAFFGVSLVAFMATAGATIQLAAEPGTEGRALGLWMIVNTGLVPIGSLALGALGEFYTLRVALAFAGLVCGVTGLVAGFVVLRSKPPPGRARPHAVGQ